jgi:hypothetical protein
MSTPISGDNSNNLYISRQMADALKNKEAQKLVNDILSDGKVDGSDNANIKKLRTYLESAAKQDDGKIDADEDALLDSIDSTGLFGTNREVVKTNLTALRNSDAEANSLNFEQGVAFTTQGGISGFFGGQQSRIIQLRTTTAELDPKSAYTEISKLPEDKQQALAPMVESARTADEQLLKQATQLRDALTDPAKVSDAALETGKPAGMTVSEYRQHLLNTVNNYIANPSDASFEQLKKEMYEENWAFESEASANSAGISKETYEVFQAFKGNLQAREQNHAALNERISAFADNQFTTPSDPSEINSSLAQNEASAKSKVSEFTEQANQVINYLKQDSVNYPGKQEDITRLESLIKKAQTEPMGQSNLDALNELWGGMEEIAFKTNIRSAGNDTIAQNTTQIESIKATDPDSAATLSLIQKTPQVIEHAALLEQLEKYPELKEAVLKGDSDAVSRLFSQSMDANPPSFMLPRNTSSMLSLDFGLGYGSLSSPYSYNYLTPSASFSPLVTGSGLDLSLGMNTDLTGGFTNTGLYSLGSSFDDQTGLGFGGLGSRLAPTNFAADPNFAQNQTLPDSILPQNNIGNLWREVSLSDVNALMNAMSKDPALGAAVANPEASKINNTIQSHEQLRPIIEQTNAASNYSTAFNKAFWQNNSLLEQAQAEVGKTINTRNNTISELEYSRSQITSALSDPKTSPEMKAQLKNQQEVLDTALQELGSGGVLSENTMAAIAPITRALNNKDQNMTLSQKLGQEAVVSDFNAAVQSGELGKLVDSMLQSPNVPDSQKQALASLNNQLELETILNNPAVSPQLKQSLLEGMQFATRAAKSHAENPNNFDAILSEQHSFNGLPANGLMALTGLGGANKYINDNPGVDPSHFLNDMTTRLSTLSQQQFDSPEAFQQAVQEQAEAAGRSESERLANSVAQLKGIEDSWNEALNSQTEVQRQETLAALTRTANSLREPGSPPIPPLKNASDIVRLPADVLAKLSNSGSEVQKLESEVAALRQQVYPVDQQGRALRSNLSPEELVRQRALLSYKI